MTAQARIVKPSCGTFVLFCQIRLAGWDSSDAEISVSLLLGLDRGGITPAELVKLLSRVLVVSSLT